MKQVFVLDYLKKRWKLILVFLLFASLFFVTFYLYQIPVEPVFYGTILCGVIGLLLLFYDFIQCRRKHLLLVKLRNCITITKEELPITKNFLEEDYKELIDILFKDKQDQSLLAEHNRMELMDYYTMWAHQIKTPIAALRLLIQSENSEQNADLLAELFKIEEYVEMVLQYLRMESMSADMMLKKYSLDDIVKQAVRKYAGIFIRKKISLDFSELNCTVLTDEKWLVFVLEQLLSNSLKYTKENGTIRIYMDKAMEKTLIIEDNGIGIHAEDIPRVFEKGFTGFNGRVDKKSTGIGLYLCKRVLNKLSHTIEIESAVGAGTKIKLGLDTVDLFTE
ncbi:hypothetical protein EDD66_106108 [Mobilisporobacter senegalensis]|uniref:histidine kinase n=1 Tax=Mobilisporobacter senegalensis TaxID=1329262 RepID=A0A3N1XMQ0_9FIRM|nr:sensor histidine kinase [Mobilisporobacter senegalensis]ROR27411.1 hypothetical protein EDD66_106108 [Mobilisporobacter senegalensis]